MHVRPRSLAALAGALVGLIALAPVAEAAKSVHPITYRGANMHLWYGSETCTKPAGATADLSITGNLNRLGGASANALRVDVSWSSLEHDAKGQYEPSYLAKLDCAVNGAAQRGMKSLLTVFKTPCWASTSPDPAKCSGDYWNRGVTEYEPIDYSDYGDFVRYLVNRYNTKLAGIEVWNEPNYGLNLRPDPDPALPNRSKPEVEVELTRAAHAGVQASNFPATKIVTGAIEGADTTFLDQMYATGRLNGYYDLVSFHPYQGPHGPYWDRPSGWTAKNDFKGGIPAMHDVMVTHGDGDQDVFLSEFGWSTCTDDDYSCVPCDTATDDKCLTFLNPSTLLRETMQAGFIRQAFQVASNYEYVEGATLYEIIDRGDDPDDPSDNPNDREHQYGVVRANGVAKLGHAALGQASRSVGPAFNNASYRNRMLNSTGLAAYYRFGENSGATVATDSKGTNHGTYSGAAPAVKLGEWPAILGATDTSAWFDGGHMSVPDATALRMDAFTVEFAIAPEDWGDKTRWRRILSKGASPSSRNYLIAFKAGTTSRLYASVGTGTGEVSLTSTTDLPPQVWSHVAFTRDGATGTLRLYINGKLDQWVTPSTVVDPPTGPSPLVVGGDAGLDPMTEEPSHVRIDELALFNRRLTADRIADDYEALNASDYNPGAPTGLTAAPADGKVTLNWTDPADTDINGYRIERRNADGTTWTLVASPSTVAPPYTLTGLTNGTTYTYRVRAVDLSGNIGAPSGPASATPGM